MNYITITVVSKIWTTIGGDEQERICGTRTNGTDKISTVQRPGVRCQQDVEIEYKHFTSYNWSIWSS